MHDVTSEWSRLGELMKARRIELNVRWANRAEFARARNLTMTQYRLIMDAENNNRENFEDSTLALIDHAYEWEPGSARKILDGGYPLPIEGISVEPSRDEDGDLFERRVRADRHLVPDAQEHLLNQYKLLRRIPVSQSGDTQRPSLRAVAESGDPADRAELSRLAREARERFDTEQKGQGGQGDERD